MLSMVPETNLIVTGSEDRSLFFFKFVTSDSGIDMDPIRCIKLDHVAINFEWMSSKVFIQAAQSTVGNIGNFCLITKSRFYTNFWLKKVYFSNFGAIFFTHFYIFALKKAQKCNFFELQNSCKNVGTKTADFYESKSGHLSHCALPVHI